MNLFEQLRRFIRLKKFSTLAAIILLIVIMPVIVYVALQPQNIISKAASKFGELMSPTPNTFGKLSKTTQSPSAVSVATNKKTAELRSKLKVYSYTPGFLKTYSKGSITKTAKERFSSLNEQLESDPSTVFDTLITTEDPAAIPDEVTPYIEKEHEVQGTITSIHIDYLTDGSSKEVYSVTTKNQEEYEAVFGKIPDSIPSGSEITGKGILVGDKIAFLTASESNNSTFTAHVDTSGLTGELQPGEQKLLFIPVSFSDVTSQMTLQPTSYFDGKLFTNPDSVNEYYKENSYYNENSSKGIYVTGEVLDWVQIPSQTQAGIGCNLNGWSNEVNKQLSDKGLDIHQFDYVMYYFPQASGCSFGGAATSTRTLTKPYGISWMISDDQHALIHEFGHNLGLGHANTLICQNGNIDNYDNCIKRDGADLSSSMSHGGGLVHFNSPEKARLGWIPSEKTVELASDDTTITLSPLESLNGAIKLVKILKRDTGESYYISYRQPIGFDKNLPGHTFGGAQIHILLNDKIGLGNSETAVILADSSTSSGLSFLSDGKSFVDSLNKITITQKSHTGSTVTLDIDFGTATIPPGESMSPPQTPENSFEPSQQEISVPAQNVSKPDFYVHDLQLSGSNVLLTACNKGNTVLVNNPNASNFGEPVLDVRMDYIIRADNGKWRRFVDYPRTGGPVKAGSCVSMQASCTELGFFCGDQETLTATVDEQNIHSEEDESNNIRTVTLSGSAERSSGAGSASPLNPVQESGPPENLSTTATPQITDSTLPDFYPHDIRISDPNVIMAVCNKGGTVVVNNPNATNFGQPVLNVSMDHIIRADNGKWRRFVGHPVFGEDQGGPVTSGSCVYLQTRCTELGFFCSGSAVLTATVDEQSIYSESDESNNTRTFTIPRLSTTGPVVTGGQTSGESEQNITLFGAYIYLNGTNKNQLQVMYRQSNNIPTFVADASSNNILQIGNGFTEYSSDPSVGFPRERSLNAFTKSLKGGDKIKLCTSSKARCSNAVTIQEITIP